jgi:hypothetical protein
VPFCLGNRSATQNRDFGDGWSVDHMMEDCGAYKTCSASEYEVHHFNWWLECLIGFTVSSKRGEDIKERHWEQVGYLVSRFRRRLADTEPKIRCGKAVECGRVIVWCRQFVCHPRSFPSVSNLHLEAQNHLRSHLFQHHQSYVRVASLVIVTVEGQSTHDPAAID